MGTAMYDAEDAIDGEAHRAVMAVAGRDGTGGLMVGNGVLEGRDDHAGDCANLYYYGPNNNKLYHL